MEQWNFYVARHIADVRKKKMPSVPRQLPYVIIFKDMKMKLQTFFSASGAVTKSQPLLVFRIRIRIHWIHMFLGLPDPEPLVRGMDPDPSIIKQN
jgi:hypothetical protein